MPLSAWYENSFGVDYPLIYPHRSMEAAEAEIQKLVSQLKIEPSDFVLDLCCGAGRHSIALAKAGFHIVGADLSTFLLKKAVEASRGLAIPFVQTDMRKLPFMDQSYDVVLSLFTSFGYFERDEENIGVLREMARVLVDGGQFCIDYLNPSVLQERLVPTSTREVGEIRIIENRSLDADFVCKEIVIQEGSEERRYGEKVKLYSQDQLTEMLRQVGLDVLTVSGSFDGEKYHASSPRMILSGKKRRNGHE